MNSLFRRVFYSFLLSLAVLLIVLGTALYAGYRQSLQAWSSRRMHGIQQQSMAPVNERQLQPGEPLETNETQPRERQSRDTAGRRPPQESRDPAGRRPPPEPHRPIFRSDAANRALLDRLILATILGSLGAFLVAGFASWLLARSIARPAARLAAGLDAIALGPSESSPQAAPIREEGARELMRIARSANMLNERIQHEQKIRSQWARDIAHDLRTPLAAARTRLEALIDGVYNFDSQQAGIILQELANMEQLINDLEELIALESPQTRLKPERIDTRVLIQSLQQRFESQLAKNNHNLQTSTGTETIIADQQLLERALSNILNNALRHATAHSTIYLELSSPKEEHSQKASWQIAIRNSGSPIPAEELPFIFERLYRGEYARSTPGSGLGLTIARRIVQMHNGEISVTSDHDNGTCFIIRLPRPEGPILSISETDTQDHLT